MVKRKEPKMIAAKTTARSRSGKPLHVWIPDELRDALDRLLDRDRRTLTAAVELILENYLAKEGLWPPPGK